jgi:sulfite reductase alpha subunit-like flavoprotein
LSPWRREVRHVNDSVSAQLGKPIMNSSFNHDEQSGSDHAPDDRSLLILYATETGTAQDAADRIARECRRIHFKCRLSSMNAYPLASGTSVPKDRMEVERIYSLTLFQKIWSFL